MKYSIEYNDTYATYNGKRFKKDSRTGYYLSTAPIGSRRMRLHRYVWETETGNKIPKGYDVHHVDRNKDNNDIDNLLLISNTDHLTIHQHIMTDAELKARSERVAKYMRPKAIEWHKSEEGRAWHRSHGVEVYKKRTAVKYICTYCGKEYKTRNRYGKNQNTFCSNNCKSAYRRASGIDNVERACAYCGKTFIANKYSKAKYCEEHRNKGKRV